MITVLLQEFSFLINFYIIIDQSIADVSSSNIPGAPVLSYPRFEISIFDSIFPLHLSEQNWQLSKKKTFKWKISDAVSFFFCLLSPTHKLEW